jgi:CheY-like chemotaxis protein
VARIVLAEDIDQLRELATRFLERAGHTVVEATDGRVALGKLREAPVDLLLCDMFMPEMDGLQLIGEVKRQHPGTPVIAMSGGGGNGALDVLDMAKQKGADAVLYKPFCRADLLALVADVLRRKTAG